VRHTPDGFITFATAGTIGAYATSRGVPGTEHLSRAERKLTALETLRYTVAESPLPISTLNFFTHGAWSRITLGWDESGFLGWYVNFERPYSESLTGLTTMDLILDLTITPSGTLTWKDRPEYEEALRRGILTPDLTPHLTTETTRVLTQLTTNEGPFAPQWRTYQPSPVDQIPTLPPTHRQHGSAWSSG
jgi:predicted RNA-binding protein associated with RNAse of E/G family